MTRVDFINSIQVAYPMGILLGVSRYYGLKVLMNILLMTPNSRLRTRDSELATPNSRLRTRDSELATPNSRLRTRDSELATPNSRLRTRGNWQLRVTRQYKTF